MNARQVEKLYLEMHGIRENNRENVFYKKMKVRSLLKGEVAETDKANAERIRKHLEANKRREQRDAKRMDREEGKVSILIRRKGEVIAKRNGRGELILKKKAQLKKNHLTSAKPVATILLTEVEERESAEHLEHYREILKSEPSAWVVQAPEIFVKKQAC